MGVVLTIVLLIIAATLFIVAKKGWIDNSTLQLLTNVAGIVALLAAIAVFLLPQPTSNHVNSIPPRSNNDTSGNRFQNMPSVNKDTSGTPENTRPSSSKTNTQRQEGEKFESGLSEYTEELKIHLRYSPDLNFDAIKVYMMVKKFDFYVDPESEITRKYANPNGKGLPNRFRVVRESKVVYDDLTGLYWNQSGSEYIKFYQIDNYLDSLNRSNYGGFKDWRLPTLEEAMSFMKSSKTDKLNRAPLFNPKTMAIWTVDGHDNRQWLVYYSLGRMGDFRKDEDKTLAVLAVRCDHDDI